MPDRQHRLRELAAVFLRLGLLGFGGPAAHIGMMQQEVVRRRKWISEQDFLDAIGASNLIPGPTSTELVLYIGWLRAGFPGLLLAGACFITPAALLSLGFAILYAHYGTVPAFQPPLRGIQAAVIAIIAAAGWQLARSAARTPSLVIIGAVVAIAAAMHLGEIWSLLAGGILGMLWLEIHRRRHTRHYTGGVTLAALLTANSSKAFAAVGSLSSAAMTTGLPLFKLGGFFFVVGSVLYGSGYVLIAFLEGWLVQKTHLMTRQQLLDAVAVGQFTPGPVSTTATFIGYLLKGVPGAAVCTLGIFLPSFILVSLLGRYVTRLRSSTWMSSFLDAVNAGSVGLIVLVAIRLATVNLVVWQAAVLSVLCLAILVRFKINATWLIVLGAGYGYLFL